MVMAPQVYEDTTFHFYILDFYQHRLTTLSNWLRPIVKHYIEKWYDNYYDLKHMLFI